MFHVKPKNYIKAISEPGGKFIDGTFEELRAYLAIIWNPEMYSIELPDGTNIDGDDFLNNYFELLNRFIEEDTSDISLN